MKYSIPAAIIAVAWLAAACVMTTCGVTGDIMANVWLVASVASLGLLIILLLVAWMETSI